MKILLVDDDIQFNQFLTEALQNKGVEVVSAFNSKEAISLYHKHLPDLVISDMLMPEGDGVELITALRLKQKDNCKIIAISGGGVIPSNYYLELSEAFGVNGSLHKPFTFTALWQLINDVLGVQTAEAI